MSAGKARLAAAAMVFGGWLLFLIWLAWTAGKPTVVSRPQFLVANLYVVADLKSGPPPPLQVRLPGVFVVPQTGWPTSLPWAALVQVASKDPTMVPAAVEVPMVVVGDGPCEEIQIKEVLWPKGQKGRAGETCFVRNLRLCDAKYGWQGPGTYVLALTQSKGKDGPGYRVTAVPRSPGYEPAPLNYKTHMYPAPIYRDSHEVRRQVEQIITMYHGHQG